MCTSCGSVVLAQAAAPVCSTAVKKELPPVSSRSADQEGRGPENIQFDVTFNESRHVCAQNLLSTLYWTAVSFARRQDQCS